MSPAFRRLTLPAAALCLLLPFVAALPAAEPTVVRVVSYNIRVGGMGMDGKRDLGRTAEVLRALRPDIVLLQEVDQGARRSGSVDVAKVLGDALGLRSHFGPAIPLQGGFYGNALLSRFPAAGPVRLVDLPGGAEHRVALLLPLRIPTPAGEREVLAGSVHLDFRSDAEMLPNAEKLAALLAAETRPVIFGGDINFWPGTRTLGALEARLTRLAKPKPAGTYPADKPRGEIDHLFVHPAAAWRVRESRVVPEAVASDHRPIVAEIELLPPAGK